MRYVADELTSETCEKTEARSIIKITLAFIMQIETIAPDNLNPATFILRQDRDRTFHQVQISGTYMLGIN